MEVPTSNIIHSTLVQVVNYCDMIKESSQYYQLDLETADFRTGIRVSHFNVGTAEKH